MLRYREALATLAMDRGSALRSVSGPWILALAASKAGDLATTVAGLTLVDGLSERNPIANAVFQQFGVAGLCVMSVAAILTVVLVVEWAASALERHDETEMGTETAYLLGYVPLVGVFTSVAVYNAVLLCTHATT